MNGLSEDDSSDSSSEYLVHPSKINLRSSFFDDKKSKIDERDDSEEETDEDLDDPTEPSNIELFTQVLKNLESSQQSQIKDEKKEGSRFSETSKTEAGNDTFNEINELLLRGESSLGSPSKKSSKDVSIKTEEDAQAPSEYTIPKDGVNIVLPGTSLMMNTRKKKKGHDLKAILRKRLRDSQILIEKVGLLCWLAYGFHLNRQINQPEIMSGVLSLMSSCNYPKDKIDLKYLEKFTKWFKHVFTLQTIESNGNRIIDKENLSNVLKEKKVSCYKELVLLYVATLRALGLNCRLVISLYPPHKVFSDSPIFKMETKEQDKESKPKSKPKAQSLKKSKEKKEVSEKKIIENSTEGQKNAKEEAKKRAAAVLRAKPQNNDRKRKSDIDKDSKNETNSKIKKSDNKSSEKDGESDEQEKKGINLRQLRSSKVNSEENKASKSSDLSQESDKQEKKGINLRQLRSSKVNSEENKASKSSDLKPDGKRSKYYIHESSSDSEIEFQPKPKRPARKDSSDDKEKAQDSKKDIKTDTKKDTKKNNRKLVSSDSESEESNQKDRQDIWAEIYLESESNWICVSLMDEKVQCVDHVYKKATKPVLYVVAWNSNGLIKDVTRRYCPQWLMVTRKQRVDEKWWKETISPWKEKDTAISKAEDEMLLERELAQPLPKSSAACKGHPLYVIQKHLLKFEALYPPDCAPLGYTSTGDAIYSRHCVHTLCSRETWLRQARVVKPKQEPYKIVKSRPKYDKLSGMKIKDLPLEVFGEWQTTQYEPPVAKDGIVPRNEYGNVDLFKACMLPKGTVHINLPGLYRVAKKLNIDCAPAVVGFNFGGMGAVPATEGFVVCEEYEDTLREAWEAEQREAAKRAREKRDKRVYGNWKKLIHGLLIRERLAIKYQFRKKE
ncbi:DNA repair protein complementing XP-C cells homolog [Ceratina calcarata]|uniref:DNA repair protein complementing XP-C cells homolog n=1 Tax=Ceratina calcarata TaxID=156304 RepID=A0AAJ7N4K4_9HYME|nr:DNA repair protein complementing XP-C cells homolog [Ceratina calcarata]